MHCEPPRITIALSSASYYSTILNDARTVRNTVFVGEERHRTRPDQDEYDELPSTKHVVVYVDSRPAAAARVHFPSSDIAHVKGSHFGLPLERLLDLSSLKASGLVPAECTRVSVLKKYRKREVTGWLLAGIYEVSRHAGIDLWVAVANAETGWRSDALLMAQVASAQQLDGPYHVSPWASGSPPAKPSVTFYKSPHWELARQGRLRELPLPGTLKLFTRKMGARLMGDPLYVPDSSRWAFPISAMLSEIPGKTREQFDSLDLEAHRAP